MKKSETEFKLEVVQSFLVGEGGAKLLARRLNRPVFSRHLGASNLRSNRRCHEQAEIP
jgi:hypothetical protein